jgi:SET domain
MSTRWTALRNLEYGYRKLAKTRYIYVAETDCRGFGIYAARNFHAGQVILRDDDGDYYDSAINLAQVRALGVDMSRFCFQVDYDKFLLPHGSIDDLINHSCRPNTGIRLTGTGYDLLALGAIEVDDELTYDYSTYIASPERLSCSCGASSCRGEIGRFSELDPRLQAYYIDRDVVGAFARVDGPSEAAVVGRHATR